MDEKEVLKENIKTWAKLDEICKMQSKISEIRKERSNIESNIMQNIQNLNIQSKTLVVDNKQFQLKSNKHYQGITMGYLKTCLMTYFNDEEVVKDIIEHVKNQREYKINNEFKDDKLNTYIMYICLIMNYSDSDFFNLNIDNNLNKNENLSKLKESESMCYLKMDNKCLSGMVPLPDLN